MVQHFEDLEFTVLVPLILKHFLNCHSLTSFGNGGLEDHTERPIADDLVRIISEGLLLNTGFELNVTVGDLLYCSCQG